jgi:hypothetical protein
MRKENGQILLVVILTVVIALTIGLSVASRTITNLKLSKQNEESQRAFQAAEAGLSQAIQQVQSNNGDGNVDSTLDQSKATFTTTTTQVGGKDPFLLNGGQPVPQDVGLDVWLSKYPNYTNQMNGTVTLYWGETGVVSDATGCSQGAGNKTVPAIEVFVLSGDKNNPTPAKYLFDSCGTRQTTGTLSTMNLTGGSVAGTAFDHSANIPVSSGLIMKVIPIYNSGKVGIKTTDSNGFQSQGTIISSIGTSGDTQRKVNYYQSYPQIPDELFPYAIISQ